MLTNMQVHKKLIIMQDAYDAAEALRKEFAQETEDLLLQAGAAKASSTNIVNTASTPVSTASPYGRTVAIQDYRKFRILVVCRYGKKKELEQMGIEAVWIFLAFCLLHEIQSLSVLDVKSAFCMAILMRRSMIGSLMYLTASRPDIMFAVCACSRFQVTPKTSHLSAVKRIFRYLKGKPKLGLWYPRVSSFDLEAYSDSDYAGANLDRKSTIGGVKFLGVNIGMINHKLALLRGSANGLLFCNSLYVYAQRGFWKTDGKCSVSCVSGLSYTKASITMLSLVSHFNDVDGIDSLNNQAIFDAIKLMGFVIGLVSIDVVVIGILCMEHITIAIQVIPEMLVACAAVDMRVMEEIGVKVLYGASKGHFYRT
ncbi:hypothetical protein Tco_0086328 [Tanacetum coccineum]